MIDIRNFENTDIFETDLKQVFDFIRYSKDGEKLKHLVETDCAYRNISEDAYDVIAAFTHADQLTENKNTYKEGGRINMCEALTQLIEDGRNEGISIGRNEGRDEGISISVEKNMKEQGIELVIEQSDKREVSQIYKCFFMDLFKQENGYAVLSKTFSKENPPYAQTINGIPYLGLPFLEKYICVSDNKYIITKSLIGRELFV